MNNCFSRFLFSLIILTISTSLQAEDIKAKKNQVHKENGMTCALKKGKKWVAVTKKGKGVYAVKKSATTEHKNLCRSLLKPSRRTSLTDLPDSASIIKSGAGVTETSGTPPTVAEIIDQGSENTFFRAGVVAGIAGGSPSDEQCNEFFGSTVDGQSGGMSACQMAENVVYSTSEIARSGTSLCYMRNFPTTENLNAGAVEVVSGELPAGDIEQVFNVPANREPRLVKVNAGVGDEGNQNIFIRVYSSFQNAREGNQYKFDIWFCEDGAEGDAQEYEQTRITAGGEYITTGVHTFNGGTGLATGSTKGFLIRTEDGSLVFDTERAREATFGGFSDAEFGESNFKSFITVSSDNEITTKVRQSFGEVSLRRNFSVARYSGSGIANLQFIEGASKEDGDGYSFSSASEFRDTFYASSPESEYADLVNSIDFETDTFYANGVEIPENSLDMPCDAEADIVLALDMNHPAMEPVGITCEGDRIDGNETLFCQTDAMAEAQNSWFENCNP